MTAHRRELSGDRWHFQHGPIDLVIGAEGLPGPVQAAHRAAWARFVPLLDELVAELPLLRAPVVAQRPSACPLTGGVARRMWLACHPHRAAFITPMAAVAGSVADELTDCYRRDGIARAWVNNGGDIALHLAPGQAVRIGLVADLARVEIGQPLRGVAPDGRFTVSEAVPVRGVATSGWRGRSFSLGIADSVTVLARTAAEADAAATVIANAVDVDDSRIVRMPACELKDDSDLGEMPVTVDVLPLARDSVLQALRAGARRACELQRAGLIHSALLVCQKLIASVDGDASATLTAAPARIAEPATGRPIGSVFA